MDTTEPEKYEEATDAASEEGTDEGTSSEDTV